MMARNEDAALLKRARDILDRAVDPFSGEIRTIAQAVLDMQERVNELELIEDQRDASLKAIQSFYAELHEEVTTLRKAIETYLRRVGLGYSAGTEANDLKAALE